MHLTNTSCLCLIYYFRREQRSDHEDTSSNNDSFTGVASLKGNPNAPDSPSVKRQSRHIAKLNMGESLGDIHVCIMCLRAIMNNKVIARDTQYTQISRSLRET